MQEKSLIQCGSAEGLGASEMAARARAALEGFSSDARPSAVVQLLAALGHLLDESDPHGTQTLFEAWSDASAMYSRAAKHDRKFGQFDVV